MSEITSALVSVPLHGRDVKVLPPDFSKLALLQHQARILQRGSASQSEGLRALDLTYRIVRAAFPDPEDLAFVEDLLADGTVSLEGLVPVIVGALKQASEDEEPAKPAVRRGRPRKKV